MPGLTGVVHRGAGQGTESLGRELTLAPGDHASFGFVDHPEITLELRRETYPRLPLSTLINLRELGQQLVLGAGLLAGLVVLVRHQVPVNALEVKVTAMRHGLRSHEGRAMRRSARRVGAELRVAGP